MNAVRTVEVKIARIDGLNPKIRTFLSAKFISVSVFVMSETFHILVYMKSRTPTQMSKSGFFVLGFKDIGSSLVAFQIIFEAL